MVLALTFTGNVDPTALATFLLAALTLVAVVVGGRSLGKTQDEIDLSRREVEEAHRPVIVPMLDDTQQMRTYDDVTERRARPFYLQNNRLVVPIKNIGSGPALRIIVYVQPVDDTGQKSAMWGDKKYSTTILGLGVGEVMPVMVYVPSLADIPSFGLWVTYVDVAEKTWITVADYVHREGGAYADMSIATLAEYQQLVKEQEGSGVAAAASATTITE